MVALASVAYSTVAYNGPGGPFSPRLLSLGTTRRALSDELSGSHDLPSYTVTLLDGAFVGSSDTTRPIRALYEAQPFQRCELVAKMASLATLEAGGEPTILYRCLIQSVSFSDLTVTLIGADWLTAIGSPADWQRPLIRTLISQRLFSGLLDDDEALGVPLPFILGTHTRVPLIPLDRETIGVVEFRRFLVCGHAVASITALWAGEDSIGLTGEQVLVPGYAGWATITGSATPYRTINGQRCTIVYVWIGVRWHDEALDGSVVLTATVSGVEDSAAGDGSGAVITDRFLQELWVWKNLILGQITTTPLEMPTWSNFLPCVPEASYTTARTGMAKRLVDFGGELTGTLYLGGTGPGDTVSGFLAGCRRETDTRGHWTWQGQYAIKIHDRDETPTTGDLVLSGGPYLFASGPMTTQALDAQHYTRWRGAYGRLIGSDGWLREGVAVWYAPAVDQYGLLDGAVEDLPGLRDEYQILNAVVAPRLSRHAGSRLSLTAPLSPRLLTAAPAVLAVADFEPGEVHRATHPMGMGASGWVDQPIDIEAIEINCDAKTVQLTLLDHTAPYPIADFDLFFPLTSITRVGTLATAISPTALTDLVFSGDVTTILFADPDDYNGTFTVTVTGEYTFEYQLYEDPGVDAGGVPYFGTYDSGARRAFKEHPPRSAPKPATKWPLGGSNESALTPALNTWVDVYQSTPVPLDKSEVANFRVAAVIMLRTDDSATTVTARITLADGTVIATGDGYTSTTSTRRVITLQSPKASPPVDLLTAGDQIYKCQVKRTNSAAGGIYAYGWIAQTNPPTKVSI